MLDSVLLIVERANKIKKIINLVECLSSTDYNDVYCSKLLGDLALHNKQEITKWLNNNKGHNYDIYVQQCNNKYVDNSKPITPEQCDKLFNDIVGSLDPIIIIKWLDQNIDTPLNSSNKIFESYNDIRKCFNNIVDADFSWEYDGDRINNFYKFLHKATVSSKYLTTDIPENKKDDHGVPDVKIQCDDKFFGLPIYKINVGGTAFAYPVFVNSDTGKYVVKIFIKPLSDKMLKPYQRAYKEMDIFEILNKKKQHIYLVIKPNKTILCI